MDNSLFVPFGNNLRVVPDTKDQIIKTDSFCEHGKVVAVGAEVKGIEVGNEISFWLFGWNRDWLASSDLLFCSFIFSETTKKRSKPIAIWGYYFWR